MEASLRTLVRKRAGERCEYCRLPQEAESYLRFHVEHVVPRQHGGKSDAGNLALACHHCNLHKGPNLSGIDSNEGATLPLFNPRLQGMGRPFRNSRRFHRRLDTGGTRDSSGPGYEQGDAIAIACRSAIKAFT